MSTANLEDMALMSADALFGNRVMMAVTVFCWSTVPSDNIATVGATAHRLRQDLASKILLEPTAYKQQFVNIVSSNQIAANGACSGGTLVGMAAAAVTAAITTATPTTTGTTDQNISDAIAAAFNFCISGLVPGQ
jgi:phosphotransferase system IIB component